MNGAIAKAAIEHAESVFAVSNTPSYLVRKLREDDAIRRLAEATQSHEVYAALTKAVLAKPKTLHDVARPYALLVALSWYADDKPLRQAAKLKAAHSPWFATVAEDLLNRRSSDSFTEIKINPVRLQMVTSR